MGTTGFTIIDLIILIVYLLAVLVAGIYFSKKEMKSKFALYQEEGVREYWVVDPERELVFVYVADNKKFKPTIPIADDYVYSTIFPDFKIHTSDLFHIKN